MSIDRLRAHYGSSRVERALAGNAMSMVFQPITELASDTVVGVEALARFACEPRRPPDQWFAEAAQVGIGTELELAAVRAALAAVDRFTLATFVSVNVSPSTAVAPSWPTSWPADRPGASCWS